MNIKVGDKIGHLTILEKDEQLSKEKHRTFWKCQCDCGNIKSFRNDYLISGRAKACNCVLSKMTENLTGQQFGQLKVLNINFPISKKYGRIYYDCQCECGNITTVRGSQLKTGMVKSCGCLRSTGELYIKQLFDKAHINYQREYSFSDLRGKRNPLRFDFAVFNTNNELFCLIEYQGEQHFNPEASYYTEEMVAHDKQKKDYCKLHNILLYEITYKDNIEERVNKILSYVN